MVLGWPLTVAGLRHPQDGGARCFSKNFPHSSEAPVSKGALTSALGVVAVKEAAQGAENRALASAAGRAGVGQNATGEAREGQ